MPSGSANEFLKRKMTGMKILPLRGVTMVKRMWRLLKVQGKRLLMLRDDPTVIARGIAVGIVMNFIPTMGFGLPLVFGVAGIVKGHKMAAVVSSMSIKPTFPLLYMLNYVVGSFLVEGQLEFTLDWHVAVQAGVIFFVGTIFNVLIGYLVIYRIAIAFIVGYRTRKTKMKKHVINH